MKLTIFSPTKTYIREASSEEISLLRKQLTYTNSSVSYMLSQLKRNKWLRQSDPNQWKARVAELEAKSKSCLLFEDETGLYFRTGFIPHIRKLMLETVGGIKLPVPKPIRWHKELEVTPYPFQIETVVKLIQEGHGSAELATGLGKSLILLMLARTLGGSALIVTPSVSIFNEILESFRHHLGPDVGAYGDGHKKLGKITIAVAKSLTLIKPGSEAWKHFSKVDMVASDESHLNPSTTNEKVFHELLAEVPYRFFVSATQSRNDGALPLLKSINGRQVYEKSIEEGIKEGYLTDLEFRVVNVESSSSYGSKDAMKMKRHHYLYNKEILDKTVLAAEAMWKSRGEQSLILVEELEQIQELLKRINVPATYVHGNMDTKELAKIGLEKTDMKKEIERFNSGQVAVFIGTKSVSVGTNFYPTHNTFDLQGVSSEISFFQGPVGRSTRLFQPGKCRYFKEGSVPKNKSRIWMFRVKDVKLMENQLEKRIDMARTTGCAILE